MIKTKNETMPGELTQMTHNALHAGGGEEGYVPATSPSNSRVGTPLSSKINASINAIQDTFKICTECENDFVFTKKEAEFYLKKNRAFPQWCKPCRMAAKIINEKKKICKPSSYKKERLDSLIYAITFYAIK